jgi:hypothetical protein
VNDYPTIDGLYGELKTLRRQLKTKTELAEKHAKTIKALEAELLRLKSKGGWSEVELVQDKNTGMMAAIRTEYRVEAYHMRLDFTRDMFDQMQQL